MLGTGILFGDPNGDWRSMMDRIQGCTVESIHLVKHSTKVFGLHDSRSQSFFNLYCKGTTGYKLVQFRIQTCTVEAINLVKHSIKVFGPHDSRSLENKNSFACCRNVGLAQGLQFCNMRMSFSPVLGTHKVPENSVPGPSNSQPSASYTGTAGGWWREPTLAMCHHGHHGQVVSEEERSNSFILSNCTSLEEIVPRAEDWSTSTSTNRFSWSTRTSRSDCWCTNLVTLIRIHKSHNRVYGFQETTTTLSAISIIICLSRNLPCWAGKSLILDCKLTSISLLLTCTFCTRPLLNSSLLVVCETTYVLD